MPTRSVRRLTYGNASPVCKMPAGVAHRAVSRTWSGQTWSGRTWSIGAIATCASALAGIGCKCESDPKRPFTPFGVATEVRPATGPSAPEDATSNDTSTAAFTRVVGQLVNPPAAVLHVGEWTLRAPDNQFFAQYVAADLDDKPGVEVVAWLVSGPDPQAGRPARGEPLVLFQRDQPPKTLAQFPAFVPRSDGCSLQTDLTATGKTTVTWDVTANCAAGTLIPRSPYRSLTVLAPLHPNPVRLQLRLAEPIAEEHVNVEVSTDDLDGDGHDDATITFTLDVVEAEGSTTKTQPAEARLTWLDRAAGMARDNTEPKKSFASLGNLELVRAKGQNTSRQVPRRINYARRLFAYLCKESATYRVTDVDGTPVVCGDLTPAFDSWVTSEVTAALTQRHYARAVLGFEQGTWFGSGLSTKASKAVEKLLRDAIATKAVAVDVLDVRAASPAPGPHYAPLRYVEETLFVMTGRGVQRFRNGTLEDASDEVDPWTLVAFGPEAQRLSLLAFPCNDANVVGSSQTNTGNFGTALVTDILSPRPGLCAGRGATPDIEFRPVAWTREEGLSAYVGPVAVGAPPRFRQPGSPQSDNGSWAISSGKLGLLVQTPTSAEFWSTPSEFGNLTDCVISDSGARAACLQGNRVAVLTPPSREAPSGPKD